MCHIKRLQGQNCSGTGRRVYRTVLNCAAILHLRGTIKVFFASIFISPKHEVHVQSRSFVTKSDAARGCGESLPFKSILGTIIRGSILVIREARRMHEYAPALIALQDGQTFWLNQALPVDL
jgi:hypothetical protein